MGKVKESPRVVKLGDYGDSNSDDKGSRGRFICECGILYMLVSATRKEIVLYPHTP
jgi:hypothetical protein